MDTAPSYRVRRRSAAAGHRVSLAALAVLPLAVLPLAALAVLPVLVAADLAWAQVQPAPRAPREALPLPAASPRPAAPPSPALLQGQVDALLRAQGLLSQQLGLLVYSTRHRRVLACVRYDAPLIAASNTKLLTTYAALRVLGPNFQWRTRVFVVEEHDGAAAPARQGLLIEASGDPTPVLGTLRALAQRVRAEGLTRLDGSLILDASAYGPAAAGGEGAPTVALAESPEPNPPSGLGAGEDPSEPDPSVAESSGQAWRQPAPAFAVISPFVLEGNAPTFTISLAAGEPLVQTDLPPEGARIISRLKAAPGRRPRLRAEVGWDDAAVRFEFTGTVTPGNHELSVPVPDPLRWYHRVLRAELHRQGIAGDLPLRIITGPLRAAPDAPRPRRRLLFSLYSAPLREVTGDILKRSYNLAAEALLRALALAAEKPPASPRAGLQAIRGLLRKDFPDLTRQARLVDGSGLSRDNRLSARLLVRILNRAAASPVFGAEYVSAMSLAGWDGTLRYRSFDEGLEGRLRGKTGTLTGVSNLSGYLILPQDVVSFAFLINDDARSVTTLQRAQDRVVSGLFDLLVKEEQAVLASKSHLAGCGPERKSSSAKTR